MIAIGVCSAAMVIIFSVFNGIEVSVQDMYNAFYPDMRITVAKGKFFSIDTVMLNHISYVPGVMAISTVLEDNAFAVNNNQQKVVILKGIDDHYFNVNGVQQYIMQGDSVVTAGRPRTDTADYVAPTAIIGREITNELGADIRQITYLTLYYSNPAITNPAADLASALQSINLHPAGIFHTSDEFDSKYVLAPLSLAQQLFAAKGKCSSIELKINTSVNPNIQQELKKLLGSNFRVESRYEQNKTMYKALSSEKLATRAILIMVLLIASFNMVGTLSMLVLEKRKDIAILKAMGALPGTIKRIFFLEGILWALTGGLLGIITGYLICLLQERYGFIKMGKSFIHDAYPVEVRFTDLLLVAVIIICVGLLAAWYPATRSTRTADPSLKTA